MSETIASLLLRHWQNQQTYIKNILDKISDAQLSKEIALGKNSGQYLLGHLIAANESMFPLFGLGEKINPDFEQKFVRTPYSNDLEMPDSKTLREAWFHTHDTLTHLFLKMDENEWANKHTAVSEEDFSKEPHRNKANALLGRIIHQSYHVGQLALLQEK